ncbi:glyceraldehyde 3-phosphate dehydrogenase (NAD(P)+) [Marinitoga hydrogenitolerans DSM 16785]|uniref:Glyceraldehyde 3-phosphate dehydrogenase (NAD(P)+) n=1 Tax=Marinitoga hydrogenitolerans (strain DSM 16785 / JCM 12826 / AT1271) TaxID=1122195 RepID=A0A1M4SHC4_MARH1|nr:type II glyceraldehyde-3-phosphate dehydrogenase [Marinitoga hydrogenitolerans]SHE31633.1 glyceraldehyde 3-phosphate dehydrogenase (NAD(P)+) [Marinitoga hydrogenitolerans DSM 16785]
MVKVGVVGYGTIGQRLADGVALQKDMELIGIADVAPTLPVLALKEKGMPYNFYLALSENKEKLEKFGIPISGNLEDLIKKCDIILDATNAGIGAKNKKLYEKYGKKAIFQGGEKTEIADVFFHGYANFEKGLGKQFLKLTSCNTTGLIRTVDALDREIGIDNVIITIVRRVADPGDYHRGLTNALKVDKVPNHQAVDLMLVMPHVKATGTLVHTPVTHGHFITVAAKPKKTVTKEAVVEIFKKHPRIRVVKIEDGFLGNASIFKFGRDLGHPRGDLYEVFTWEETITVFDDRIIYSIHIPQESVTIPETIDGIRAAMKMQLDRLEAVSLTNKYLNIKNINY